MMRVGQIPKCGCGKTKDPNGGCDGSHSKVTESDIKDYFLKQARAFGWLARKVTWENVNNAPDWVLMKAVGTRALTARTTVWCELKRPGKAATPAQRIEHELMRRYGQPVFVLDSYAAVNEMFDKL